MNEILVAIDKANLLSASELLISPSEPVRFKTPRGWQSLNENQCSPTWIREQVFQLLDQEGKKHLIDEGFLVADLGPHQFEGVLTAKVSNQGISVHARWVNQSNKIADFLIPGAVLEVLRRGQGLSLVTGPRKSGKSTLLKSLAGQILEKNFFHVGFFTDKVLVPTSEEKFLTYDADLLLKDYRVAQDMDLIIIDSVRPHIWRQGLLLAEYGCRVICSTPFINCQTAVKRFSEKVESNPEIGYERTVQNLQIGMGLHLVAGLESQLQPIIELLFVTNEIRGAMLEKKWDKVEQLQKNEGDETGMRTLNQSLFNLMLKRKIDMKIGFSTSGNPEELDSMFTRVGF